MRQLYHPPGKAPIILPVRAFSLAVGSHYIGAVLYSTSLSVRNYAAKTVHQLFSFFSPKSIKINSAKSSYPNQIAQAIKPLFLEAIKNPIHLALGWLVAHIFVYSGGATASHRADRVKGPPLMREFNDQYNPGFTFEEAWRS